MRGCMVTAAGYSLEYIGEMDFWKATQLMIYWVKHPPVHLQLQAYLGGGSSSRKPAPSEIESAVESGAYVPGRGQDGAIPFQQLPGDIQNWLKETAANG